MNQPTVQLVPVSIEHAPAVQALVTSHPDIVKFTRLPDPYPENGAEEWIRYAVPRHESGEEYSFVIQDKENRTTGVCGLIVNKNKNEAELGYWIGAKFWNRGIATAAVYKALNFAFEEKKFNRVFALPLLRNQASRAVLEKNSFRHVKTRPNTYPKWKPDDNMAVYEITYEEWKQYNDRRTN